MAEILLTHSYFLHFDRKQFSLGQPYAPLGTLYAAAVLREAGFNLTFHDVMFDRDPSRMMSVLDKERPLLFVIYDDGFNYLTKMCLSNMRSATLAMCRMAKEKGAKVVVCSSDSTDQYRIYLEKGVDAVILGEGELTLEEVASAFLRDGHTELSGIKGIAYRYESGIRVNPGRPLITEPDILPMPAWDMLDVTKDRKTWLKKNGYFSMNLVTTRGCPYQCIWCAKPIYGNHYHSRSPENVVKEMKYIKELYAADKIWFADDIFALRPGWLTEFERITREQDAIMPYTIQTRADLVLEDNQVAPLASSGCRKAWLGIESGSQKILDAMHKGTTIEQIRKASILLRKSGIEQAFFLQLGFPGEDKQDIQATISLLNELLPDDIGISVTYPLPGTKFYESVKKDLLEKQHWTDSDDLALLFKSNFTPHFYRLLHRYIHKNFRYRQAIFYLKQLHRGSHQQQRFRRILLMPYYFLSSLLYLLLLKREEKK